jgi:hypothetical protein
MGWASRLGIGSKDYKRERLPECPPMTLGALAQHIESEIAKASPKAKLRRKERKRMVARRRMQKASRRGNR